MAGVPTLGPLADRNTRNRSRNGATMKFWIRILGLCAVVVGAEALAIVYVIGPALREPIVRTVTALVP